MHRFIAGERSAFEDLVLRHAGGLRAYLLTCVKHWHDAEDLVQQTFNQVFAQSQRLEKIDNPRGYLYQTARNLAINHLQRNPGLRERVLDTDRAFLRAKDGAASEDVELAQAMLASLNDEQREAVYLHLMAGYSFRETGEILDLSINTVVYRYQQGIQRLRELYGTRFEERSD